MKQYPVQQEILLVTGTRFASRQYAEKDGNPASANLSDNERLKEACWNGLLREMLPETFVLTNPEKKLYLWHIRDGARFFAIEMGEFPLAMNPYHSIDPQYFGAVQYEN